MNKYQVALNMVKSKRNVIPFEFVIIDENDNSEIFEATEVLQELVDKATPKKPKVKHYENEGEAPYVKYTCPNDCGIQLSPVTEKNHAHEDRFCRKCGQAIDWSEEE